MTPDPLTKVGGVESIFAPVAVARASSAIAEQIRTAILTGRLKAGDRLSPERELAEQFGVSRVTVRDALRSLEAMGLLEVKVGARGGAFVTAPTGSKVAQTMSDMVLMSVTTPEEIVEARLIVELGTVTLACARATPEDLAELRELCAQGRDALAAGGECAHVRPASALEQHRGHHALDDAAAAGDDPVVEHERRVAVADRRRDVRSKLARHDQVAGLSEARHVGRHEERRLVRDRP